MKRSITVYSDRRSNRLTYISNYIFGRRLGLDIDFTNHIEKALSSENPVLNYSHKVIEGALQIKPTKLLFEKRITGQELDVAIHNGIPYMFASSGGQKEYDILAACFYQLSRYEEYLPYRKDDHRRFPFKESFHSKHGTIQIPLVDIYILELKTYLSKSFPDLTFNRAEFLDEITVDVDQLFMYRSKGMARTMLGFLAALIRSPKSISARLDTLIGQKKDPLEIYDRLIHAARRIRVKPIFFFQVGETSRYDINNPVHLPQVKQRINEISIDSEIGLHPSYYSSETEGMHKLELRRLQNLCNKQIVRSRQHYLRFQLPHTYRRLEELGVAHDYSMGYSDVNGFRAGTSHPFPFFDLERDETGTLIIHPFVFMDLVGIRSGLDTNAMREEFINLRQTVRQHKGVFSTIWHPEVLIGAASSGESMSLFNHYTSDEV